MKPKYTIVIRDNEKNEEVCQFNASSLNYSLKAKEPIIINYDGMAQECVGHTPLSVTINATVIDKSSEQSGDKCAHKWGTYTGLEDSFQYCSMCGIKR